MNPGFAELLKATPRDCRDVFLSAAARLGTPEQNVEKDFWVTWTLDVLFNGLPAGHPRFLFKGGTSLSKAYGLISRFSEDIDITVFREDLGQAASVPELQAMSRKKREARLDAIKDACRNYIQNTLAPQFAEIVREALAASNIESNDPSVLVDSDDPDGQSLLFSYPG
jgi:predicted nucleotidyltransferase component of viral defense system